MINLSNTNISHSFYPGIDLTGIRLGVGSKAGGVPPEPVFDPSSFDQAWTVTGLTNDSPDKTTIKNLTGNGIDLTLNNFAFAGNSGYGLYQQNFSDSSWYKLVERIDYTATNSSISITSIKVNYSVQILKYLTEGKVIPSMKVKISGLPDGIVLDYTTSKTILLNITTDGVYTLPSHTMDQTDQYVGFKFSEVQESCDITIEQIPDYEGYLVTDGVDDSVASPNFNLYDDFTFVGEWKLLPEVSGNNAGIVKSRKLYIYNISSGMLVTINSTSINNKIQKIKSLKAVCSDGRVYDESWNEIKLNVGETGIENNPLNLGFISNRFTSLAFKNGAFYSDRLLTKEQCIAAYEYLQTLKHPSI